MPRPLLYGLLSRRLATATQPALGPDRPTGRRRGEHRCQVQAVPVVCEPVAGAGDANDRRRPYLAASRSACESRTPASHLPTVPKPTSQVRSGFTRRPGDLSCVEDTWGACPVRRSILETRLPPSAVHDGKGECSAKPCCRGRGSVRTPDPYHVEFAAPLGSPVRDEQQRSQALPPIRCASLSWPAFSAAAPCASSATERRTGSPTERAMSTALCARPRRRPSRGDGLASHFIDGIPPRWGTDRAGQPRRGGHRRPAVEPHGGPVP